MCVSFCYYVLVRERVCVCERVYKVAKEATFYLVGSVWTFAFEAGFVQQSRSDGQRYL